MTEVDKGNRRHDVRYGVFERCGVTLDGRHFEGLIVDMSLGGAALRADVQMATQPSAGTPVTLDINRVGRVPAKVVRPLFNGIAVEFDIDRDTEDHLVGALMQVLADNHSEDG